LKNYLLLNDATLYILEIYYTSAGNPVRWKFNSMNLQWEWLGQNKQNWLRCGRLLCDALVGRRSLRRLSEGIGKPYSNHLSAVARTIEGSTLPGKKPDRKTHSSPPGTRLPPRTEGKDQRRIQLQKLVCRSAGVQN
jgi:hypothetical protein